MDSSSRNEICRKESIGVLYLKDIWKTGVGKMGTRVRRVSRGSQEEEITDGLPRAPPLL